MKLRPRPDADRLVVARFDDLKDAGGAARAVMASDLIPSALELLDGEALRARSGWRGGRRRSWSASTASPSRSTGSAPS